MTGLETNFAKTCLYSSRVGELTARVKTETLHCNRGLLPITYLGIPISGRRPRRQDWDGIIHKVRRRLSSWKLRHISLGGRLTLVNSVMSAIPTYWMSIFCLPVWVINDIDRIKRDFLWSGLDINHPGCRLVSWKLLCRPRDQGGWGILDLAKFNQALLGKWWWKYMMDPDWDGAKVILFNYGSTRSKLWPNQAGRISFFWKGVLNYLPALRSCLAQDVVSNKDTLFWKDKGPRTKMEDDISTVRRSLEFLDPRVQEIGETQTSEETHIPGSI
ncbi:uncharacterized mitochondrial protein AtMg00310-like [Dioscorea cayenensis subsp. rotundata]|uniref:Uncharacterized mitochondrial protein AtMg00310-like n=1 Tax=Dioscorea cayennensis subsp. rotundata TaxID=55577 RepID=A0AB40C377_DIOCR|nr:uncharacterized mitochondrial protein AtMg00310-like [Dioscorea cayenensis subsp. rotundata]